MSEPIDPAAGSHRPERAAAQPTRPLSPGPDSAASTSPASADPTRQPAVVAPTEAQAVAPTEAHPTAPTEAEAAARAPRPAPGFDHRGRVRRTRVSGVWAGLIATALFLILLIVFIAQNSRQVQLHFFGWHGQFSLALTILLSAVIGLLVVAIPGTVRILQLRRALRKNVPDGTAR